MAQKLLFLILVLVAGCSKPKEQPAAQNASQSSTPGVDNRPVIVAFGDSLTAGFGAEPGRSYPDYLQKQIDGKKLGYRVVNAGVSGETTTDALGRVSVILAEKPAIVIVEFGGNDGLRGLPVSATRSNLDKIVSTIQASGAKVILAGMTLPPNYGTEYIGPFEQIYQDLAKKYKVTLIPFLLKGVATNPDLMQQDGIHPTAEGNRIVGDTVFQYLQRTVK